MKEGEIMDNKKLIGGIILIVLGIIFLLTNLGYISFDVLFGILDLWPLLLIVAGINVLFNKKPIITLITWIVFFIILILYGAFYGGVNTNTDFNTHFTKPVETSHGKFNLDIGAAKVNINSEENNLLKVNARGVKLDYSNTYKNNKETVIFNFANRNYNPIVFSTRSSNYNFRLNEDVVWDLDLDLGAISGTLDLENIATRSIDLNMGAGNLDIILGNKHDISNIKIDSGASNLNIAVPKDVGIKIKLDSALSKININDLNLIKTGDYYMSPNYEEKDTKLEFYVSMGVGNVDFRVK